MSYLLIAIAWLALFHFVYEGIVAPAARMKLRNRLFALRDEVRAIKIEGVSKDDEDAFWLVHNGINSYLTRLPQLTVTNRQKAREAYLRHPELRELVDKNIEIISRCSNARIKAALDRAVLVVGEAYVVNSGGWLVYLVPVGFVLVTFKSVERLAMRLILLPDRYTDKVLTPQAC